MNKSKRTAEPIQNAEKKWSNGPKFLTTLKKYYYNAKCVKMLTRHSGFLELWTFFPAIVSSSGFFGDFGVDADFVVVASFHDSHMRDLFHRSHTREFLHRSHMQE